MQCGAPQVGHCTFGSLLPLLPPGRDADALQNTDTLKTVRYTARDSSSGLGSANTGPHHGNPGVAMPWHDPDRWRANLNWFGLTAVLTEVLIRDLTSQTLTEFTNIYSVLYAALQNRQHAHNG